MEFVDWMILKAVVVCVLAFFYGIWRGFLGDEHGRCLCPMDSNPPISGA